MGDKPFDLELYKENDRIAKITAVNFLESTGKFKLEVPLDEQPERFKKADFAIKYIPSNRDYLIEVERKVVWNKSGEWQGWTTLDVPTRKRHSSATLLIMINKHLDTLAVMLMSDVKKADVYAKPTYLTSIEEFFAVSLDKVLFYTKENDHWVKIL